MPHDHNNCERYGFACPDQWQAETLETRAADRAWYLMMTRGDAAQAQDRHKNLEALAEGLDELGELFGG